MQKTLQLLVTGWIVRGVYGLVILPEELVPLTLRQIAENDLRIIRILNLDWLG